MAICSELVQPLNHPRRYRHSKFMARLATLLFCWLALAVHAQDTLRYFRAPQIEALGRALYEQQRRIEIAADFMNEYFDPKEDQVIGWVTEGDPKHFLVRFVRMTDTGPIAVLDAVYDGLLIPTLKVPARGELSAYQLSQMRARMAVQNDLTKPCARNYESIALPDPDKPGLLLYALAVADSADTITLGGHYRFSLNVDGDVLTQADAMTTSCVTAALDQLKASDGAQGVAIRANLSDTPLEIHVYLSLRYHVTLYVVTRDLKMWEVKDGKMRIIRERPGESTSAGRASALHQTSAWAKIP